MKWRKVSEPISEPGDNIADKEKAIAFCEYLLERLRNDEGCVRLKTARKVTILDDSGAELELIDGAMRTVGGNADRGDSYELEVSVWK